MVRRCVLIVLLALLPLAPPPAAAKTLKVGGAQLDLKVLRKALRADLREALIEEAESQASALLGDAAAAAERRLRQDFAAWLDEIIISEMDDAQRLTIGLSGRDSPDFREYRRTWIEVNRGRVETLAAEYMKGEQARSLLQPLIDDGSMEIASGLKEQWEAAQERLARFKRAVDGVAEESKIPWAKTLKKHGFSGDWFERFKGAEDSLRNLNQATNAVEASTTVLSALLADRPRDKIAGFFGVVGALGGALEQSRVPLVSFLGQIASSYAQVAEEMLAAVGRLEKIIEAREQNCIGADVHRNDSRDDAFVAAFPGVQACPLDDLTDVYVKADDASHVYFWIDEGFVAGSPEGGGAAGVRAARAVLAAAVGEEKAFAGLADDTATLHAVYSIPGGVPELEKEAHQAIYGIATRVRALTGAPGPVPGPCVKEGIERLIADESGLDLANWERDAEDLDRLELLYVLGRIAREVSLPLRPNADAVYAPIWDALRDLSLLDIHGGVTAKRGAPCPDCAGARLSLSLGNARRLPGCPAPTTDERGFYRLWVATRSPDFAVTLVPELSGARPGKATVTARHVDISGVPFVESFRLPFQVEPTHSTEEERGETDERPGAEGGEEDERPAGDGREGGGRFGTGDGPRGDVDETGGASWRERFDEAVAACDAAAARAAASATDWRTYPQEELDALERGLERFRAAFEDAAALARRGDREAARARLREAQELAPCDARRREAAAALAEMDREDSGSGTPPQPPPSDTRAVQAIEAALRECRFGTANKLLKDLPADEPERPRLQAAFNKAWARERPVKTLGNKANQARKDGRYDEALALMRKARAGTECAPWRQQADQFIARIEKERREADPAMVCEKRMKGSVPDQSLDAALSGETQCVCPRGTRADPDKGACVFDRQDDYAYMERQCATRYPGSTARWDAAKGKHKCVCPKGTVWDKDSRRCKRTRDSDFRLAKEECADKWPGSVPRWDADEQTHTCACPEGTEWNGDRTACERTREARRRLADNRCAQKWSGSVARWSDDKGRFQCACPDGWDWNRDRSACVDEFVAARQRCDRWPGSVPVWQPEKQAYACQCQRGEVWSESENACVYDTRRAGGGGGGASADCPMPDYGDRWDMELEAERSGWECCPEGSIWHPFKRRCVPYDPAAAAQAECEARRPGWEAVPDGAGGWRCQPPGYQGGGGTRGGTPDRSDCDTPLCGYEDLPYSGGGR